MKKMVLKITCVCLLIFTMCINVYAEVTPKPMSPEDEVTTTVNPNEIVAPETTTGIDSEIISADNPNPPANQNSENSSEDQLADNPNPSTNIDSEDQLADNPNPPTDIDSEDQLADNPNPPTDVDSNSDGCGTTTAPKTGDASNVVLLSISVLLSCSMIAFCYRKGIKN